VLKQLFEYLQQSLLLVHDVRRNQRDIEELRRELKATNALVIELSHKLERLSECERLEREKMALQLENVLLRFERLLPPPGGTTKSK